MKFRHFAALLLVGSLLFAAAITDIPWTLFGMAPPGSSRQSDGNLEQPLNRTNFEPQLSSPCGPPAVLLTPVTGAPALLVSASWDEREGPAQARLLTIVKREGLPALCCLFCCGGANGEPFVHSPARVEVHRLHFNFPWATADVLCTPPNVNACSTPQGVTLVPAESPVPIFISTLGPNSSSSSEPATPRPSFTPFYRGARGPLGQARNFTHEFGVCISTLFGGYDNVLQFAQAVELYRLLGASIVTVYNSGCGPMLARLLAHYQAAGIVEVVPWLIGIHLQPSSGWQPNVDPGDVHYHGQTAALNDCLYRRMDDTRYLAMTDIDEVIVPLQHEDWAGLMKTLTSRYRVSVFHFRNYVFPHSARNATLHATYSARWRGVPGHDILTHVLHEPVTPDSTKMMLEARRVVRVSVHSVLRSLRGQQIVPTNAARMFHFRNAMRPEMSKEQLSYDTRLWRYNASLVSNVDAALSVTYEVECFKERMSAKIAKSVLLGYGASDLVMNSATPACRLTESGPYITFNISLGECGTVFEETSTDLVFSQTISLPSTTFGIITYDFVYIMVNAICKIPRTELLSSLALQPNSTKVVLNQTVYAELELKMDFYKSSTFLAPYLPTDYPLVVQLRQTLYLQLSLKTGLDLSLFTVDLYATPTNSPLDPLKYYLVKEGCLRDSTVNVTITATARRFTFPAFAFTAQDKKYVSSMSHHAEVLDYPGVVAIAAIASIVLVALGFASKKMLAKK
ncbi:uncharacterized protein LOC144951658 [Lampetra fluviatilis]